jgi:hypothetical protein
MDKNEKQQLEKKFQAELLRADTLSKLESDPLQTHYWSGYMRGLRYAFYQKCETPFGTYDEHRQHWRLIDDTNPYRKERGRGYREGMESINGKLKGRPSMGERYLNRLKIPEELFERIERVRGMYNMSLPDFRRESYRKHCDRLEKIYKRKNRQ